MQGGPGDLRIVEQFTPEVLGLNVVCIGKGHVFQANDGGKKLIDIANGFTEPIGALIRRTGLRHPSSSGRDNRGAKGRLDIVFRCHAILLRRQVRQEAEGGVQQRNGLVGGKTVQGPHTRLVQIMQCP